MSELEDDLSLDKLWIDLKQRLSRVSGGMDPQADVAAVAGMYDLLSYSDANALARFMLDELRPGLRNHSALTPLQQAILGLADPYFINADVASEARLLIAAAFGSQAARSFQDKLALAHGLIDLSYRTPGSDSIWINFARIHAANPNEKYDALDAALAGLALWNIEGFKHVLDEHAIENWIVDRIDSFLPTLSRRFSPVQVTRLLQSIYDRCSVNSERQRLIRLADAYDCSLAPDLSTETEESKVRPFRSLKVPEALLWAHTQLQSDKRSDPESTRAALARPAIQVFWSGYTGEAAIDTFQLKIIDKVHEMAGGESTVFSLQSSDFAELNSPIGARRKAVFAFPTYLTATKRAMGYSCCSFGMQRSIGVLYPGGNRLTSMERRPTTLEAVLRAVMLDRGMIYCVRNYAIAEIVRQAAELDSDLEQYFDEKHIHLCEEKSFIPQISHGDRNFIFIFDLAGYNTLDQRRKQQTSLRQRRSKRAGGPAWFKDARIDKLTHAVSIEVGIVFSKYMVEWLMESGRWDQVGELLTQWAKKPDFIKALNEIGIEVGPIRPTPEGSMEQNSFQLRAANDQGRKR